MHRRTLPAAALAAAIVTVSSLAPIHADAPRRPLEPLGRGVVAVPTSEGRVFVSWRLLATDPDAIAFNLYRATDAGEPVRLNDQPLTAGTNFTDQHAPLDRANAYFVRGVLDGRELQASAPFTLPANAPVRQYLSIPLQPLDNHYVHLAWVGDLDGDGEYEFVVDRLPREAGLSQKLDAYRLDGTFLWRIDFGPNSVNRAGARWSAPPAVISNGHNDGVTVFDLDLDGKAEVVVKSAAGVVFGDGRTLAHDGDIETAQFISVLDGQTGRELARAPIPDDIIAHGPVGGHMGVMFLDGQRPSIVFKTKNRIPNGPFNLMTVTYDYRDGQLALRWKWVRQPTDHAPDFHQIRIVDVDRDGKDELCDGGFVLDDDGTILYSIQGIGHGDRFHVGDLDPDRPGLEGFAVQQRHRDRIGWYYYDAGTGEILRRHYLDEIADVGRGTTGDIDPAHPGYEYWARGGVTNAQSGVLISSSQPSVNFRIWWDGDLLGELLDRTFVEKWNPATQATDRLLSADADGARHSWRNAPPFYGDILGDWREEILFESQDHTRLMIYTTTIPSDVRLDTLPHNPAYRAGMTVKGYLQSHMVDFYLGHGMTNPRQGGHSQIQSSPAAATSP